MLTLHANQNHGRRDFLKVGALASLSLADLFRLQAASAVKWRGPRPSS
jgi:hypothetical protein